MEKTTKILSVVLVVFLLANAVLGFRYWSLSKSEKAQYSPTPCETPQTILTPLLPPPGELLHSSIVGIQHHEVDGQDVYQIIGWVIEADEQKRQISLGQIGYPSPHQIFIPQAANIRAVFLDESGQPQFQPKTFGDLIPGKIRISILCRDASCSQAEIVSIIETQNL